MIIYKKLAHHSFIILPQVHHYIFLYLDFHSYYFQNYFDCLNSTTSSQTIFQQQEDCCVLLEMHIFFRLNDLLGFFLQIYFFSNQLGSFQVFLIKFYFYQLKYFISLNKLLPYQLNKIIKDLVLNLVLQFLSSQ